MSDVEDRELLKRWDALLRETSDEQPETFLQPPAPEAAIAALETRLGTALPPSYRAFLAISDGANAFPGWGAVSHESVLTNPTGLRAAASVDWIRNGDRMMVAIWAAAEIAEEPDDPDDHPFYARQVPEREYLLAEPGEQPEGGGEKRGHLRHVLEVSSCIDGYATYLNPLVVDADGEWEAWDFGTKTLGAVRYPSFRALIEADIAQLERQVASRRTADAEVAQRLTELDDRVRAPIDRVTAAYALFWRDGLREVVVEPVAEIALDPALDLGTRQAATQLLGYVGTGSAMAALARLAGDPDRRLLFSAGPALAASSESVAMEATRALLTDRDTPDFAFSGIYRCSEAVWDAWQDRPDPRLLVGLARCGDERIVEPLADALVDPATPEDIRRELVSASSFRLRDRRLVPALVAAAALGSPWERIDVARSLAVLGATGDAVTLLGGIALEPGIDGRGAAVSALGLITDPSVDDVLLAVVATDPSAEAVEALGWHASPAAAAAIEPLLDDARLHLVGIDALEVMHLPEATNALVRRSASGDVLATRALARLGDRWALGPLLALLVDPDPAAVFRGVDGLRDLRDPASADAVFRAVDHSDADVAACAAHALVSMASPRTPEALDRLAASPDDQARALAIGWRAAWARRPA